MQVPKFQVVKPSFHVVLKQRIEDYFESSGKESHGNTALYIKAGVFIAGIIALYVHLVFFTPAWYFGLLECAVMGLIVSGIGFNIMHDGSHGSFSRYKWLNMFAAHSLNVLGGSSFMWNMKHNMIHHAYTNIDGMDDDVNIGVLMRMNEHQKRYKFHKFQHLYFWFLYMLLYVFWIFFTDYKKYFTRKIGSVPLKKMSFGDHILFWVFKVLNIFLLIVLPIYMVGHLPWLFGFLALTLVAGFVLSIVFQLAHTVEDTHFPHPEGGSDGKMEDEWAVHQIRTTANFATNSKVISWLVGGLNFQVEHHLFPKISHIHYPAISKIISETCAEYGIPYIVYPKMRKALASHVSYLRKLGKKDHQYQFQD
jgi:linoleoyl-CoA desaturase